MLIERFEDTMYEKREITHIRHTVRLFVQDEQGLFWFLVIRGKDDFGQRNHYETIGGGIEAEETYEEAIRREVMEEIGYEVEHIQEIGMIIDRYYLIGRETHSHFFYVTIDSCKPHERKLTKLEQQLFFGLVKVKKEDIVAMLALSEQSSKVDFLVQRRDLRAFEYAVEMQII